MEAVLLTFSPINMTKRRSAEWGTILSGMGESYNYNHRGVSNIRVSLINGTRFDDITFGLEKVKKQRLCCNAVRMMTGV